MGPIASILVGILASTAVKKIGEKNKWDPTLTMLLSAAAGFGAGGMASGGIGGSTAAAGGTAGANAAAGMAPGGWNPAYGFRTASAAGMGGSLGESAAAFAYPNLEYSAPATNAISFADPRPAPTVVGQYVDGVWEPLYDTGWRPTVDYPQTAATDVVEGASVSSDPSLWDKFKDNQTVTNIKEGWDKLVKTPEGRQFALSMGQTLMDGIFPMEDQQIIRGRYASAPGISAGGFPGQYAGGGGGGIGGPIPITIGNPPKGYYIPKGVV